MIARRATLASVAALTAFLSGCAGVAQAPPVPEQRTAASSSPAASATGDPVDLTEPASLLPDDCAGFVSDPSMILGESAVAETISANGVRERQAGDLSCSWVASSDDDLSLSLEVRRHAAVLAADPLGWWSPKGAPAGIGAEASAIDCRDSAGAGSSCDVQARTGDYWFRLQVITPTGVSAAARRNAVVDASRSLVSLLMSRPVPSEGTAPDGSWPAAVDCAALGARADVASAVGIPETRIQDTTREGDEFTMSEAVARLGGQSVCTWTDARLDTSGATFSVISARMTAGGGWSLTHRQSGSEPGETIEIPGADQAEIACFDDGTGCAVSARLGVNVVTFGDPRVSRDDLSPTRDQVIATARTVVTGLRQLYP